MMERVSTYSQRIAAWWNGFRASETGASLVEYALLLAVLVIVVIVSVSFFGSRLDGTYDDIGSSLVDAGV